jgi:hypothetical protein
MYGAAKFIIRKRYMPGTGDGGYFIAGADNSDSFITLADKITYASDTTAAKTTANLDIGKNHAAGINGGTGKGYILGGVTGSLNNDRVDTVEKTDYITETTVNVSSATLPQVRAFPKGVTEGSIKGYIAGGYTTLYSAPVVNTADKLTFSTEVSSSQSSANLTVAMYEMAGLNGGSTKGYWAGGTTSGLGPGRVEIDKIVFSTDTTSANTSGNLTSKRYMMAAISDGSTKGYVGGGLSNSGTKLSSTDLITFSSDTSAAVTTADLSSIRMNQEALSNASTKGYFGGGTSVSASMNWTDKTMFATDTTARQTSADLSSYHSPAVGLGNI